MTDPQRDQLHERLLPLVRFVHRLSAETDELAAEIAEIVGLDPSDEAVTEAIWNAKSPEDGEMILMSGYAGSPDDGADVMDDDSPRGPTFMRMADLWEEVERIAREAATDILRDRLRYEKAEDLRRLARRGLDLADGKHPPRPIETAEEWEKWVAEEIVDTIVALYGLDMNVPLLSSDDPGLDDLIATARRIKRKLEPISGGAPDQAAPRR